MSDQNLRLFWLRGEISGPPAKDFAYMIVATDEASAKNFLPDGFRLGDTQCLSENWALGQAGIVGTSTDPHPVPLS